MALRPPCRFQARNQLKKQAGESFVRVVSEHVHISESEGRTRWIWRPGDNREEFVTSRRALGAKQVPAVRRPREAHHGVSDTS